MVTDAIGNLDNAAAACVSDAIILGLQEHIHTDNRRKIRKICTGLSDADIAEVLAKIDRDDAVSLIETLGKSLNADVFAILDNDVCTAVFAQMTDNHVATILNKMESDDALDLIADLDDVAQQKILKTLSKKMRATLEEGLTFPEDSAGRLMQRELISIPEFWTVGKTLDFLRAAKNGIPDHFYDIMIVDPMHHVVGEVPAGRILCAPRQAKLKDLCLEHMHPIKATMDQEDVAHIFRREGLVSAPVINDDHRLIGVITIDDIVGVIDEEAQEDLLKLGGISTDDIYRDVLRTTRSRFSWLAINLITAIMASIVIALFETTLDQIVALAILMPIVASMGGNAGTQTLTVAVRALATKELSAANAWRVIGKELSVGLLNGISFAVIIGCVTWLWFSNPALGIIIAAAMMINLIVAGFFGAIIPIILARYNMDPAIASSVFLTTLTDMVGFFAFLGLAAVFLV